MGISNDLEVTTTVKELMRKSVKIDRMYYDRSIMKRKIAKSTRTKKKYTPESPLDPIAVLWNSLTPTQQEEWDTVAAYSNLIGYRLFVQEMTYRLANGISGFPTLSIYHQFLVYRVDLPEVLADISGEELHYEWLEYKEKNIGQKNARTWVPFSEVPVGPFTFQFNYYADIELLDPDGYFEGYIQFYGIKNGSYEYINFWFEYDIQTDWKTFSQTVNPDLDEVISYKIVFNCMYLTGFFMFDNIKLIYDGQNFSLDPFCNHSEEYLYRRPVGSIYRYILPWDFSGDAPVLYSGSYYPT